MRAPTGWPLAIMNIVTNKVTGEAENGIGIVRTTVSAGSTMTAGCTEVGTSTTTTTKRDVDISAPRAKDKAARRIQRKQNRAGSAGDTSSDDTPTADV